jgi:alkylation response protein AidB-like acyl-CoA dehydrogenase
MGQLLSIDVDLATTPALAKFRDDLRGWLAENLTDEYRVEGLSDPTGSEGLEFERRRAWQKVLFDGGWVGVHWPIKFGGRSASLAEHALYLLECAAAGAPEPVNSIGIGMVGPTLIEHGTPTQLDLLPGILSADTIWAQLFSEPEAGSDLGALTTRAHHRDDGSWVINGQKLWTTLGPNADMGLLIARTGNGGFSGISCFLVDMRSPGVTVRGLKQMSAETHFAEVFFDDVALEANALVGAENQGWSVALTTLGHERTTAILSRHATTAVTADRVVRLASRTGTPPPLRDRAMRAWIDAQLFRMTGVRAISETTAGQPSQATWPQRMHWGLVNGELYDCATALRGGSAMLTDDEVEPEAKLWSRLFLASRGWTIGGGTTEIQRNMLGEKVLGLPREPKPERSS